MCVKVFYISNFRGHVVGPITNTLAAPTTNHNSSFNNSVLESKPGINGGIFIEKLLKQKYNESHVIQHMF